MTEEEINDWGTRLSYAERGAFLASRDERQKIFSEIEELLGSVGHVTLSPPEWLRNYALSVHNLLGFVRACDELADEANTTAKVAEIYIRASLASREYMLHPINEEMARGAALAASTKQEHRLASALNDPISFDVACRYAAWSVEKEETLTHELKRFIAGVLTGEIKRPTTKNGQKPFAFMFRDVVICEAIQVGERFGLPPTRNDVSAPVSGCDVVAAFLSERGMFPATFAGVKRVWLARGEGFETFCRTMRGDE